MFKQALQKTLAVILENALWIIITTAIQLAWVAYRRKTPMLDGKELEGKIGEVGGYSLDVTDKGHVITEIHINLDKELTPGVDAKLNVQGAFQVKLAKLAKAQALKTDNKILKYIAGVLEMLDNGEEAPAALVAIVDQAAVAPAADSEQKA